MARPTSYTDVRGIGMQIAFNQLDSDGKYIPITVYCFGQAVTPEGAILNVSASEGLGAPSVAPKTPKELYNMMPSQIQSVMKEMYLAAIDTDITA